MDVDDTSSTVRPPLVSVVIPTYNRRAYIQESLDSVLNQTFSDFEVIVVDDGSTDRTEDVLRTYRGQIRYIRQDNRGGAGAHNTGVRHARGKYIAFMDSDDISTSHHLKSLSNFLEESTQYAMVVGNGAYLGSQYHSRKSVISSKRAKRLEREVGLKDVFDGRVVRMQGTMIHKAVLEEIGLLDDWFRISYDLDLAFRVLKNHRIGFLNQVVYFYRKHEDDGRMQEGHISGSDELRSRENLRALQKLTADYPGAVELIGRRSFSRLCAHRYCRLAKALAKKGEMDGAREAMRQAVALQPFSLKYRLFQYRWA